MNPNLYDVLTMRPPGEIWGYVRNIPNEPSKCNQWKHFHQMLSEYLKCSLPLPTGHIVGKMHMSSKCTQHVITGFQAPLPPVTIPQKCEAALGEHPTDVASYERWSNLDMIDRLWWMLREERTKVRSLGCISICDILKTLLAWRPW